MDERNNGKTCIAFNGTQLLALGDLCTVAENVKETIDHDERAAILIFDAETSEPVEVDLRGTIHDVLDRLRQREARNDTDTVSPDTKQGRKRGPGPPTLGVVAREVTLLPRHWDWLNSQPGGASVALRKLVEEARRGNVGKDRVRQAKEATYRFMYAMAGNFPGFEEATRALFAGDSERFHMLVAPWSADIRDHARKLAHAAFQQEG